MELFDTNELRASERRRVIDAEQVPGQIDVFEAIAEVEGETVAEDGPVFAAPAGELFALGEAERGQLVLA